VTFSINSVGATVGGEGALLGALVGESVGAIEDVGAAETVGAAVVCATADCNDINDKATRQKIVVMESFMMVKFEFDFLQGKEVRLEACSCFSMDESECSSSSPSAHTSLKCHAVTFRSVVSKWKHNLRFSGRWIFLNSIR